jgi:hypothetical protein
VTTRAEIGGERVARLAEFARDGGDENAQAGTDGGCDDRRYSSTGCYRAKLPDAVALPFQRVYSWLSIRLTGTRPHQP